ncbi:hypothetical protein CEXT_772981 [Caerostris extrusa]|uniref:Uncharacterized protein n=1 Tax=Caerostris extrusa TaxID=172846 RepID=A0AAV4M6E9_CAEEX|nr:hypothetical protein CEXT_772981 [Caerostris extrusa]
MQIPHQSGNHLAAPKSRNDFFECRPQCSRQHWRKRKSFQCAVIMKGFSLEENFPGSGFRFTREEFNLERPSPHPPPLPPQLSKYWEGGGNRIDRGRQFEKNP